MKLHFIIVNLDVVCNSILVPNRAISGCAYMSL